MIRQLVFTIRSSHTHTHRGVRGAVDNAHLTRFCVPNPECPTMADVLQLREEQLEVRVCVCVCVSTHVCVCVCMC
jgi:hypothetical protein